MKGKVHAHADFVRTSCEMVCKSSINFVIASAATKTKLVVCLCLTFGDDHLTIKWALSNNGLFYESVKAAQTRKQ